MYLSVYNSHFMYLLKPSNMEYQYESHSTIYHVGQDFRASIGIAVMIGAGLICLLILRHFWLFVIFLDYSCA